MLRILPAAPGDTPVILDLIHALAEYEKATADEVPVTEAMLHEALFGERPAAEAIIAWWDGRPAGFALYFHNFSTWQGRRGIYLEDLFVYPDLRGLGIGKALLQELARIARERNCARLEWMVLNWNTPAIGFYEKLGARRLDAWSVCRVTGEALERLSLDRA